jgi:hypothetical protein
VTLTSYRYGITDGTTATGSAIWPSRLCTELADHPEPSPTVFAHMLPC